MHAPLSPHPGGDGAGPPTQHGTHSGSCGGKGWGTIPGHVWALQGCQQPEDTPGGRSTGTGAPKAPCCLITDAETEVRGHKAGDHHSDIQEPLWLPRPVMRSLPEGQDLASPLRDPPSSPQGPAAQQAGISAQALRSAPPLASECDCEHLTSVTVSPPVVVVRDQGLSPQPPSASSPRRGRGPPSPRSPCLRSLTLLKRKLRSRLSHTELTRPALGTGPPAARGQPGVPRVCCPSPDRRPLTSHLTSDLFNSGSRDPAAVAGAASEATLLLLGPGSTSALLCSHVPTGAPT